MPTISQSDLTSRFVDVFTELLRNSNGRDPTTSELEVIQQQSEVFSEAITLFINNDTQITFVQNPVTKDITSIDLTQS